jgi:hypothetical protein
MFSGGRFTRYDERFSWLYDWLTPSAEAEKTAQARSCRPDDLTIELAAARKTTGEVLNKLIMVQERHITGPSHAPRPKSCPPPPLLLKSRPATT